MTRYATHGGALRHNLGMRLGIAHHFGWAVVVTATDDHEVVDRRRIELIGPDLPAAPVHHEGGPHDLHRTGEPLDDDALAALVAAVNASAVRATGRALDEVVTALHADPLAVPALVARRLPAGHRGPTACPTRVAPTR